ncbi:GGDEF domain-containing protein [Aquipseudomonas alcaligenes]|uniref:diguanylate cyclase n=1 Tax=Aquipseudomonas alcaligenes TaxID=43263 RepID=A0AA37CHQ4_AQUAC|nr:GGDEF domain-containing protein [Pseudomonas alcaligenes]BCR23400.1 GGDEF domain-containing protein [Pseudomonas alcaligenes]GIZ68388.1 GGDEF domain-containing protein [Pseudomonas alcaligenes]GIZ72278.1 GGDEF domain-containing protein [Pseudomonas alcaligenes]GIZ76629.1 GGDEF domain-containing protein [Pseudomonas alcaligenes]GIZ81375.1 GGDEF domain-containing protein [Pseudomonas alcaligenes]
MPTLFGLHRLKLAALLLAANAALLLHLGAGDLKPMGDWVWLDILGEGGSALLCLVWLGLVLKSRPAGRVTNFLAIGLGLVFLSWWVDALDEFILLPDAISWDHWLESAPMPLGLLLLTLGIYHWHREQLAISAQMEKRERLFREHLLFDKLTPLNTADYLRRQLQQSLAEARAEQQPLSLVILDLDDFSQINRLHGHAEGDRVLQALTQLLLLNLRHRDLLCRLAGDRFVVLLPNTGAREAQLLAEELRLAVAHLAYKARAHGERLQLQASTAAVMALQDDADGLLQRLNLALAKAKQPPYAHSA